MPQHESKEYKIHNPNERKLLSWRRRIAEHAAVAVVCFLIIRFGGWYQDADPTNAPVNASTIVAFVAAVFIGFLFVTMRVWYCEHAPEPAENEFGPDGDDYEA
jgi:uncharacterized membrane protein YidH (DUF202 family)